MKGITLCAECAYYSMKKHACTRGATDESDPRAKFYGDCPLQDVAPVVRCKDCAHWVYMQDDFGDCTNRKFHIDGHADPSMKHDDFCSCGERREK